MITLFYSIFDFVCSLIVSIFVSRERIAKQIDTIASFSSNDLDYYREVIDTVQSRASILLAHIAIVLAILSLSITKYANIENMIFLFSVLIVLFLFVTLLLMRIIGAVAGDIASIENKTDYLNQIRNECVLRFCYFRFSIFLAMVLTFALIVGFVIYPPIFISPS